MGGSISKKSSPVINEPKSDSPKRIAPPQNLHQIYSGPETMPPVSLSSTNASEKPGVDRLTNLDNNLLGNILSRLPTNEVVRTRILSKDWGRCKWMLTDKVDTDLEDWGSRGDGERSFIKFLDEMLSNSHLRYFRATFQCGRSHWMHVWFIELLEYSKNLECLDVNINTNDYVFPCSLLNSVSLRELKVVQPDDGAPVRVTVAEKNRAPRLTSLSLYNVTFVNQNCESGIVSFEFPALEKLELRMISFCYRESRNLESVDIEIYAPLLTSFSFQAPDSTLRWDCSIISIKIVAPRLNRLSCYNGLPDNIVLDRSSIVSAFLSTRSRQSLVLKINGAEATQVVDRFVNLEELMLSSPMAEVLRDGPPLRVNDKLKRLTLHSGSKANQLFKLLHEMPSLIFVSINVDEWEDYDYEATETPSCIASRMEEVVLQEFSGEVPQYNLAQFLLKTATKLKKLTITTTKQAGHSEEMKKVLSAFDICSPSLEISSSLPDIEDDYTYILSLAQISKWSTPLVFR